MSPPDIQGKTTNVLSLKARVWIARNDETCLSFARVTLLERIREYGSITKAAKSMNMSYRHTWKLVDSMNRTAIKPLLTTVTGGKGGGGTCLTKEGEKAIAVFWDIHKRLADFMADMEFNLEG